MNLKEWSKYLVGSVMAGITLVLVSTLVVYPAVNQLVGLAVVGNAAGTQWNNVKDVGIQTDAVTSGMLSVGLMGFNGTTFDRLRSSIANGLQVDVTRISGNVSVIGTQSDNSANSTAKLPVIPCRANAAAQSWTEGNQVPCSTDLSGNQRVLVSNAGILTQGTTLLNSQTTSGANSAAVITLTGAANTRVHLYKVQARCSNGITYLQVQDGATLIYDAPSSIGAVPYVVEFEWSVPLTATTGNNMVVTIGPCGTGNTSTTNVEADRY